MNLKELVCINKNIDIDKYIEFRENVKTKMDYPDWLGDLSKEDLIFMLENGSKIWIYYLNNGPVCSMMLIPFDVKSLNNLELSLDIKDVVDYGPIMVNPKYVGNKLQYQMLKELDEYCLQQGFKYAVCTVHPDNIYSINNLLKDGFKLINQKDLERGIRNIYLKEFNL